MNLKLKKNPIRVKNKILTTFTRFFLSSFIVILFFYISPIFVNFADKNLTNQEFTNNSKNILNRVLNKDKLFEEDDTWSKSEEMDLLYGTYNY